RIERIMSARLFVLDTNVLMHDPTALFRFDEHDVFIPMVVLEELDAGKKGTSEVARNVRQTSRFFDALVGGLSQAEIEQGISLNQRLGMATENGASKETPSPHGRLFFETRPPESALPVSLPGGKADNSIL